MKCNRIQEMFSDYMENAMDARSCVEFEQHLTECACCSMDYDRFTQTVTMLDEMPEVEPPADFHASVMARVERARRTAPRPVRWWEIDWQRVFTIRVPARAVAMGLTLVLLMVLAVRFTGLSTITAGLFTPQKVSARIVGQGDDQIVLAMASLEWKRQISCG